ncbi:MAG TPA: alkaline phosphatase family protein [Rheinheimera sp.]|uniref:alkaline phosphatase family protein n=1 Tax=Rheinheimera sp. TaxID=1869214 RepID=UPI002B471E00|nr:alkaline phosphatase family protein [Rheinheimera sp.]HJS13642.1 alkaline phosphatase family protein [Rheinheimera sp.]
MMKLNWLVLLVLLLPLSLKAEPKVVLVSIDGVRWQEVFAGADPTLYQQSQWVKTPELIRAFKPGQPELLMPFLHKTVKQQGITVGDRSQGSAINVSNPYQISYPGYQELLAGFSDPSIRSNNKVANPNVTVLEWLNQQPQMQHKVAAFGSWDLFPYILNTERSGLTVNAGFMQEQGKLSEKQKYLNQLQAKTPSPFASVRLDVFTQEFALEHMRLHKPKLLYIALGEADDFAHLGQYDQYLAAIHRSDQFIADLWQELQNDPYYRDQTTLLISTDHGRGEAAQWRSHGKSAAVPGYKGPVPQIAGSEQIWLAAMGPEIPAAGLIRTTGTWQQGQMAATMAAALGFDYQAVQPKAAQAFDFNSSTRLAVSRKVPAADHQGL